MSLVCDSGRVLALSALGLWMTALYAAAWSVVDLVHGGSLEPWANLLALLAAALLAAATFLVRAQVPGGLPLAASGLLALQALAVHSAAHLETGVGWQIARAVVALGLLGGAAFSDPIEPDPHDGGTA